MLLQGAAIPLPPFGYALNNPAAFTDPDGRIPPVAIAWGLFVLGLTALEFDSGTFTSDGIVGDALTALSFLPVIGTEFQIFRRVSGACDDVARGLENAGPIARSLGAASRAEMVARRVGLNINSPTSRQILNSLDITVTGFIGR